MKHRILVLSLVFLTFSISFLTATAIFDELDKATGYYKPGITEERELFND